MFEAKILADSVGRSESRLVTMQLTYPRCIHSEFMTHRQFSRNAASSRAIPIGKMIQRVVDEPFIPLHWGINQKGMQAESVHSDTIYCEKRWLFARDKAVESARELSAMDLHKQIVNRILEPFMWITVIATGVGHAWENFFKLRCHPDAEPHIQKIAYMARHVLDRSQPAILRPLEWHLPLFGFSGDEGVAELDRVKLSTARCARVSYLTHDGKRDVQADIDLHDRLATSGHWSPFEHAASVTGSAKEVDSGGNFGAGWFQYRKTFNAEYCKKAPR